jgi:LuxR family maltose regulon positive regulatory protein
VAGISGVHDRVSIAGRSEPSMHDRPALDAHYESAAGCLVRVIAPAGYGKTTTVGRWVTNDARDVIWLDLENIDNDPVVLLGAITRGMAGVIERPFEVEATSEADGLRFPDVTLPWFGDSVATARRPFVLVLDDVQNLRSSPALAIIATLAANVPLHSTIVMIGRSYRDYDSFAKLRLRSSLVDITVDDLALDLTETEALLASRGVQLGLDELTELTETFEGWPAGLRLASLVMSSDHTPTGRDSTELGDLTFVTDFLRAEWLGDIEVDDRILLREAACLGRFTARMCDEVLDRSGCANIIRRLDREQSIALPLDRRGEWYRMHPLLERWLSGELRANDPARWREVHFDAARWWEHEGDIGRALDHLTVADDTERRGRLIVRHAASFIAAGHAPAVRHWLSSLPGEYVRASPGLCALEAVAAISAGDGGSATRWLSVLSAARERASATAIPPWADVVTASLSPRSSAETLPVADAALVLLDSGAWRAFGCLTAGTLRLLHGGDEERAIAMVESGAHEAAVVGSSTQQVHCLAVLAIVADLQGDHARSSALAEEAFGLITYHRIEGTPTMAPALAVYALAQARSGRRSVARDHIVDARRHLIGFDGVAPWFNVLTRLALVRAVLLVDAPDEAASLLAELDRHMRLERDDAGLARHVALVRSQVDAAREVRARRSCSLSDAELRVLQHLPTNLSLADIATLLFVSRNTVKSHVAAIYRKLGTTSRGDAVRLAAEAGLLGERGGREDALAAHHASAGSSQPRSSGR